MKINENSDSERLLRKELPEDLSGIPIIHLDRKRKDIENVYLVDGHYLIDKKTSKRMIVEYRAKDFEDANRQAKEDGLVSGIMIEAILTPPEFCVLGLTSEGISNVRKENEIYLESFYN